jgi:hypothetical protein
LQGGDLFLVSFGTIGEGGELSFDLMEELPAFGLEFVAAEALELDLKF